jgi:hypothetical protein
MWVSASPLFRSQPGDFPIRRRIRPSFMNRMLSALLVVILCIMGAILFYLPWTSIWEKNYFLSHFPSLMRILLHPAFRGAVSGLGVLDIFLAINMIGAEPAPAAASRVNPQ